ncbi:hypothetical protein N5D77_07710 [Comamonas thiooxydans]|uniref:Uncharacterized protein n=1 Tax=Comamonas thiooxydans TaxID=363952 RepID=A0AA42TNQ0_9BURK|nr:hypothetical protein [Comamonas thiooxydans]MDH1334112.1 hypothetical protein [Comamonas thiooxydans]MDH1739966.1 hypothetical protein [Comamonas thiooxydans]MDH1786454.1 hypothetical protein [Comamonas thiooxydans]OAD82089.1 hypothetical protein ATN89_21580 [Comamonas thiooxydans]
MHPVLLKTFGGLSKTYYFRQLFFGVALAALGVLSFQQPGRVGPPLWAYVWLVLSTLLYPYARFVYESIVGFIVGNHQFAFYGFWLLLAGFIKLMIMALCFSFAIFIAPLGLAYLYYHHSK